MKHPVDEVLPPARLGLLGLQHVLAMYTGCVTVPLVLGAAARGLARGLAAEGVSGGAANGLLGTVFGQNVGLVGITKVSSRYVAAVAGVILVVLGLVRKLGETRGAEDLPLVPRMGAGHRRQRHHQRGADRLRAQPAVQPHQARRVSAPVTGR